MTNLSEEQKQRLKQQLKGGVAEYEENKRKIDSELSEYKSRIDGLPSFVEETDAEFERLTKITKKDAAFLVFASTLQVARQIITSHLKTRLSDKQSAQNTPFHSEEHSSRRSRQYYATKAEIAANPVPFDAIRKTSVVKANGNPKLSGFNHRYKAIGHDPLLGLIFGTANIMTKTITVAKGGFLFETYHVGTGLGSNKNGVFNVDMLTNRADTSLMFSHIISRIKMEQRDGWEALGLSFGKELVHLLSDVRTSKSLPIPVVSAVSPDISRVLNLCGIDTLSTVTFTIDILLSKLIDISIAYMHTWCYNPQTDGPIEIYMVRTKNIVYYSNMVSLASTTIQTLCRAYMGDASAIEKFDFGGAVSAWNVIWNTPMIISNMKSEFIRNKTINYLSK